MLTMTIDEASALLEVNPNTLRAWEHRFGFPKPIDCGDCLGEYTYDDVVALRDALYGTPSVAGAVLKARDFNRPRSSAERAAGTGWAAPLQLSA